MGFSWTEPMKEAEQDAAAVSQPVDQRIISAANEENVAHEAKVAARRTVPVREPVACYTPLRRTATYSDPRRLSERRFARNPSPTMPPDIVRDST